jgi:hypothetical protein
MLWSLDPIRSKHGARRNGRFRDRPWTLGRALPRDIPFAAGERQHNGEACAVRAVEDDVAPGQTRDAAAQRQTQVNVGAVSTGSACPTMSSTDIDVIPGQSRSAISSSTEDDGFWRRTSAT